MPETSKESKTENQACKAFESKENAKTRCRCSVLKFYTLATESRLEGNLPSPGVKHLPIRQQLEVNWTLATDW